ncbi:histidine phosphatase family protein [Acidimangrovimonas sediminis]|uniref:histidine phosphatase family protein n=1 Tax=Acidimangrovimonas sediminis TaxID=2056283 RepID=UPI001E2E97CF|nr:histidine phosphatase family protein [Acidimangrovimonas sediminis]
MTRFPGGHLWCVSHPEVAIDPGVPVPDWPLSDQGRARAMALASTGWPGPMTRIVSSPERKARETAEILARGAPVEGHPHLAEIDRSSTGYVPHARHEALADALFADPDISAAGWETARAAQARAVAALEDLLQEPCPADLVIVGHGGVGTLLWCHLAGRPISRVEDQPTGGCVWATTLPSLQPVHPWRRFEALAPAMPHPK